MKKELYNTNSPATPKFIIRPGFNVNYVDYIPNHRHKRIQNITLMCNLYYAVFEIFNFKSDF